MTKFEVPTTMNLQSDMMVHIKRSEGGVMGASQLVRQTRRAKRLSQRSLALRAGISQPALADIERSAHDPCVATLDRVLAAAGCSLTALPTLSWTVSRWADFLYEELRGNRRSEDVLFRAIIELSDCLFKAEPSLRVALCVSEPALCGDPRFDAFLAAVVRHHLSFGSLPLPPWVDDACRFLGTPWEATPFVQDDELLAAFHHHGILLAASELASI